MALNLERGRLKLLRENWIIDSSTLISLERVALIKLLDKTNCKITIPSSVKEEIGDICDNLKNVEVKGLSGNTLKISKTLQELKIGKGESDCIALAKNLGIKFILCDDRKLLRQIFFSKNKSLKEIKILGFSFLLHEFYKNKLITDIWDNFQNIIKKNGWKRSEVQVSNYMFLRELGY